MSIITVQYEEFEDIAEGDDTEVKECEKHYRHNGSRYEYVFNRDGKFYQFSLMIFEDDGVDECQFPIDAYEVEKVAKTIMVWKNVKS